ncbi:MAG: AraC family transcriptional regulator [Gammaproteobacteria bacterium]|nr:AraC family transcriptional regulator [Gammaproteobacteria bacterium]
MNDADFRSLGPTKRIRDVEEALDAFSKVEVDIRFDRQNDRRSFSLEFNAVRLGAAGLMTTKWGTDSYFKAESSSYMAVVISPADATPSVFTTSGETVVASTTTAPILHPEREVSIIRPAEIPVSILSVRLRELEQLFQDITGTDAGHLEFDSSLDLESAQGRRLLRVIGFALQELSTNPSAVDHPIVRRQLDDLVLSGFLSLPGQHHRLVDLSTSNVGTAIVRRAEEFMEANLGNPITMSDVAAACDCSRTRLFLAFKRERRWTPLQFLVRKRMERARRLLLSGGQGLTVTKVALDSGYASLSRFSQEYRKLYGEMPSMTLHRGR